jgi:hypothetical protein
MKSLTYATLLAFALTPSYGFAQGSTGHNMSDEEPDKAVAVGGARGRRQRRKCCRHGA